LALPKLKMFLFVFGIFDWPCKKKKTKLCALSIYISCRESSPLSYFICLTRVKLLGKGYGIKSGAILNTLKTYGEPEE